ncbi:hypothetical protein BDF19DRAFT_416158 [Syncephalis fuscata]|nr:hypothetical protein BDF19DRAFT_416158 [Syncephalis fuscata]
MAGWQALPIQVRQCILLFCDGYTVANLAYTCRDLYNTLLADQWLWASLYEVTFPQTEEERHWREWCLAGVIAANGYTSCLGPSPQQDEPNLIVQEEQLNVDWYRVFVRRTALARRWRHGLYQTRRIHLPLSRQPSKSHVHMAVTSPWRTLLVLGDEWSVWMVEHGVCPQPPYKLNWTPGCWPGPREFLQNADYIVAVNSFAGHQHSTWVWRAGNRIPITYRWPILSNSHCCPVALYGRWLLVTDTERYIPVDPVTGKVIWTDEDEEYSGKQAGTSNRVVADSELDTPMPSPSPDVVDGPTFARSRKFHVVDLMTDNRVYSVTVAGGYTICHFQSIGSSGVRVYCAQYDTNDDSNERGGGLYTWSLWGWRATRNHPDKMECNIMNEGRFPMDRDLFNGEMVSYRLDASRVLLETRPFWTTESLYVVHSLWDTEILYQGAAGAGRAFPLGRQQLRYLPNDRILAGRLTIDPSQGDIQIGDVLIDTAPLPNRSQQSLLQREKEERGLNIQLRRTLGALFYATPVTKSIAATSSSASSSSNQLYPSNSNSRLKPANPFLLPSRSTRNNASTTPTNSDSIAVESIYTGRGNQAIDDISNGHHQRSISPSNQHYNNNNNNNNNTLNNNNNNNNTSNNTNYQRFTDIHYIIDAHRGKLVGMLHLPTGATPVVSVCATHVILLDLRNRSLTLLDFSVSSARLSKQLMNNQHHHQHHQHHGGSHNYSGNSNGNSNVMGWVEEMAGSFKWTRPNGTSLSSLADAWRQRTSSGTSSSSPPLSSLLSSYGAMTNESSTTIMGKHRYLTSSIWESIVQ